MNGINYNSETGTVTTVHMNAESVDEEFDTTVESLPDEPRVKEGQDTKTLYDTESGEVYYDVVGEPVLAETDPDASPEDETTSAETTDGSQPDAQTE